MRLKAAVAALLGVLLTAAPAAAPPGNPSHPSDFTNNPHPAMPWATPLNAYGQAIQYITVPPQQVVIQLRVPLPDGVPSQTDEQTVEIPGYYVTETTTGYWYPERWTLRQLNIGVYQWVLLPAGFSRK